MLKRVIVTPFLMTWNGVTTRLPMMMLRASSVVQWRCAASWYLSMKSSKAWFWSAMTMVIRAEVTLAIVALLVSRKVFSRVMM